MDLGATSSLRANLDTQGKAMRKVLGGVAVTLVLAAAYVLSPLHAAWTIREAIITGDSATLAARIDWPRVRETLRQSMTAMADPQPVTTLASTAPTPPRGLWSRFKRYASRRAVDRVVDTYVTPQRLPQLFTYGTTYRNVTASEPEHTLDNLPARVREFWSRVRRAEFKTLTAFELEMQDRNDPTRHFTGLIELQRLSWKLTELRVHTPKIAADS